MGLGVTFDASAARGRRTSRQPYIVGNSDRHTGYIIDNIDLAQRLIRRAVYSQLDPLPGKSKFKYPLTLSITVSSLDY